MKPSKSVSIFRNATRNLSSYQRYPIEYENRVFQDILKKPITGGVPVWALGRMMKRVCDKDSMLCQTAHFDIRKFEEDFTLYERLSAFNFKPGLKIITPVVFHNIELTPQLQQYFNVTSGIHMMIHAAYFREGGDVELYLGDSNGRSCDERYKIGSQKDQLQEGAVKAFKNLGLRIGSVESNENHTHNASAICGMAAFHNFSMLTKMLPGGSVQELFEQITKNGGVEDPIATLTKLRDENIAALIKDNEDELRKNGEAKSRRGIQLL